jgi:hypothetical protein
MQRNLKYKAKLPPLRIYVDDLMAIEGILVSHNWIAEFRTGEYSTDKAEELVSVEKADELTVVAQPRENQLGHRIWIYLDATGSRFSADTGDPVVWGICEQLRGVLVGRERRFGWLVENPVPFFLGVIAAPVAAYLTTRGLRAAVVGILAMVALLTLGIFGLYCRHTIIITKGRADAPSFWERNWDKIVAGIITGVVVLVIREGVAMLNTTGGQVPAASPPTSQPTAPATAPTSAPGGA